MLQYRLKLPIQNPTKTLGFQAGASRFVFNWGLEQCIEHRKRTGGFPKLNDLCSKLPKLKKKERWLKEADANALQQSLRDVFAAINLMFKAGFGFPRFKTKRFTAPHFRTCAGIRLGDDGLVKVGKLGTFKVRLRNHRSEGRLKSVSCKQEGNGRWYASLLLEAEDHKPLPKTGRSIGLDAGSRIFMAGRSSTSKRRTFRRPKAEATQHAKVTKHQKALSKTAKGSNRREKQRRLLTKAHFKLANIRKDFNHKLSRKLVEQYDTIAVEDLNVKGLMRTKSAAKGFQQVAIGQFFSMLKYKCEWYGKTLVEVDPWMTSKTCSCCGTQNDLKKQKVKRPGKKGRWWRCSGCGSLHERDTNAATNILTLGQTQKASEKPSLRTRKPSFGKQGSLKREANGLSRW